MSGGVLGGVLGWVLGGVFVFCIPFIQRHFSKIGVGLAKNCTSTLLCYTSQLWQLWGVSIGVTIRKYGSYVCKMVYLEKLVLYLES